VDIKGAKKFEFLTFMLLFQEWVTDSPFIISPRITFEVSVRLLGGLMALGYTIATILKRSSHIFCDDRVSIKTDWLEQLNRHYVQVLHAVLLLLHSVLYFHFLTWMNTLSICAVIQLLAFL